MRPLNRLGFPSGFVLNVVTSTTVLFQRFKAVGFYDKGKSPSIRDVEKADGGLTMHPNLRFLFMGMGQHRA